MRAPRPTAEERRDALVRLFTLAVELGGLMERGLAERGLSRARASVIWQLHHQGPITQRALSQALRITPRSVTGLLDALEAAGFVARKPHPTDRRATLVHLTTKGSRAASALDAEQQEFATTLFDEFSASELAAFVAVFDRVLERIGDVAAAAGDGEQGHQRARASTLAPGSP